MARLTLDRMAAGGMYDQLGGGFHRYSVDAVWLVPHFEKMLYDNALLAGAYLHAWSLTGEERYRRVAEETLDYLVRDLRLPEGGFASAQDADTEGVEGTDIHVDVRDELRERARRGGGASAGATASRGRQFEGRASSSSPRVRPRGPGAREKLLEARMARPQPLRDDKAIAAWNGLALAAFAEAGRRSAAPTTSTSRTRLARSSCESGCPTEGRLLRSYRDGRRRSTATSRTTRTSRTGCSSSTTRPASCAGSRRRGGSRTTP